MAESIAHGVGVILTIVGMELVHKFDAAAGYTVMAFGLYWLAFNER